MRTYVYVDAFNLYYGALRKTAYKWLDVVDLSRLLLNQRHIVTKVKYFTARVSARPHDPDQPVRQDIYLRALRTLPEIDIHLGHFLSHSVSMPLAQPAPGGPMVARVVKTEEKGSDVNLASHILMDAFADAYDCAVVISNDSDLATPIRMVRDNFGKIVGILNPQKRPSAVLMGSCDFFKSIREAALQRCQLPVTLTDENGVITKPLVW